jgi:hypothetical protein
MRDLLDAYWQHFAAPFLTGYCRAFVEVARFVSQPSWRKAMKCKCISIVLRRLGDVHLTRLLA